MYLQEGCEVQEEAAEQQAPGAEWEQPAAPQEAAQPAAAEERAQRQPQALHPAACSEDGAGLLQAVRNSESANAILKVTATRGL